MATKHFKILSNEDLKIFKLYTHINTDLIANVEEMQLIEAYLQGIGGIKNKEVNKKYLENNNNEFISPFATSEASPGLYMHPRSSFSLLTMQKHKSLRNPSCLLIWSNLLSKKSSQKFRDTVP